MELQEEQQKVLEWLEGLHPNQGFVDPSESIILIDNSFIELDRETMENGTGRVAARITNDGLVQLGRAPQVAIVAEEVHSEDDAPPPPIVELKSDFEIHTGGALPVKKLKTVTERYPFSKLEVGQHFFVPATETNPDPAKKLSSTASSASKRYARVVATRKALWRGQEREVPVYEYDRKFSVASVKEGQKCGEFIAPSDGVMVMRVEVT